MYPHLKEVHFLITSKLRSSKMEAKGGRVVDIPSSIDIRPVVVLAGWTHMLQMERQARGVEGGMIGMYMRRRRRALR